MRKIFIYAMFLIATSIMANDINWAKDYNDAIDKAKKSDKPILFVFSRHTCKYCVILDETTFKDERVVNALNKDFISVTAYTDEQDYVPQELWRPGTPAIWFLVPTGEPMYQPIMGALDADKFLEAVDIVKAEYAKLKK